MSDVNNTLLLQKIAARLERLENSEDSTGGSPPNDGSLTARVAKLEAHVEHIQRDVTEIKGDLRSLLRWGLAIFSGGFVITWAGLIGLAYIIAKGFHWL